MTNTLVISDIHGNAPALRAVLDDATFSNVLCCGDIVGAIPFNSETVDILRDTVTHAVKGNHDCRLEDGFIFDPPTSQAVWEKDITSEQLNGIERRWLRELPERFEDNTTVMAHSSPFRFMLDGRTLTGYAAGDAGLPKGEFTRLGPHLDGKMALIGHTHQQASLNCDRFQGQSGTIVNPGSVGQPWEGEAEYALVNTVDHEVELHSVEYDTMEVTERAREYDIPAKLLQKPSSARRGSMGRA